MLELAIPCFNKVINIIKIMKKNKVKMIILGVLMFALSFSVFSGAIAFRGDFAQRGPNYSPERHALMEKAFETNDYELWKSLMGNREANTFINKDNFAKFAETHRLMEDGKYEEARQIRAELGLGSGNCHGKGEYRNGANTQGKGYRMMN